MAKFSNYHSTELIDEEAKTNIYRAKRRSDGQNVIIKTTKGEYPELKEIAKLKHEYKILQTLDCPGVVKTIELLQYGNGLALVLEDFGGKSLKEIIASGKISLERFLNYAIALATAIRDIHYSKIIHKDIKPANIVVNEATAEIKIIDFGISSQLASENQTASNANLLEGTLAYISPEQTGRMNRTIDRRTDFYSLGITFYEMLTGKTPFVMEDALELVHSHIARMPTSPHQGDYQIPLAVSNIVMKLLSKTAEARYQTASGLIADLETCLTQLKETEKIDPFPLGGQDISGEFKIPQKLYGRDAEVVRLMNSFDRATEGEAKMLLVSGYSGIGKSSLVYEIHKPVVRQRSFFISGKFDLYQRNIPYAALIQAFQELVKQLLTGTETQIAVWQEKILQALGQNGRLIIDVIPEVELIIGKQPPIPQLGTTEAQNRFNLVLQKFVRVFTQPEHPLVLFLDDLQWADAASLNFIKLLITAIDSQYLLLIGAYRDNEVSKSHPLILTLQEIEEAIEIENITVKPLEVLTIKQLIVDTLDCKSSEAEALTQLCLQKTNGNPFFLNQLLQSLYSENLLKFDFNLGKWQWNIEEIESVGITDNVVDLMIDKLKKLPPQTQDILTIAACIGNRFDLEILALIREASTNQTATDLWSALEKGFILPLDNSYKVPLLEREVNTTNLQVKYRFLHDRVQQAAYALIPAADKQQTHLKIGRLLLQNTSKIELEENIFDLVNHLNKGSQLINNSPELLQLAKLNLQAGKKAKASTAYEPAVKLFRQAIALIPNDIWQNHYPLAFSLYRELSECEYLCGNFEEAETLFDLVIERAKSKIERAEIQNIRLTLYDNRGEFVRNLQVGSAILKNFAIDIPTEDNAEILALFESELTIYRQYLQENRIADLYNAPELNNLEIKACLSILMSMTGPAYFTNQDLLALISLTMVNLSIQYGKCNISAHGYAFWGIVSGSRLFEYERGYEFGQLALKLNETYGNANLTCKVFNLFGALISPWRNHLKESIPILRNGYKVGLEIGDVYTGYNSLNLAMQRLIANDNFESIINEISLHIDYLSKVKNYVFIALLKIYQHFIFNLQGQTRDRVSLSSQEFDELEACQLMQDNLFLPGIAGYNTLKTEILYLYGDYQQALQQAYASQATVIFVSGIANQPEHYFYYSLVLTALYSQAEEEQAEYWQIIETNQKLMKIWADNSPDNFLHKYLLVEAEIARLSDRPLAASELYDRSILLAKQNNFLRTEAVGNELAAKFWLARKQEKFAKLYFNEAYYTYQRCGATAKARDLAQNYSQFIGQSFNRPSNVSPSNASLTTSGGTSEVLDLSSVTKASQAISEEILLDKLLGKLMKILIENAGAQQGFLILNTEGQLLIEASGAVNREEVPVLQSLTLENRLPTSIVNYVARTLNTVNLGNAVVNDRFSNDTYIQQQQPKSILCLPLCDRGKLISILYLENNLSTKVFTSDRLKVLKILSSQAAISIENARLYQTLEDKVRERTAELAQANAEISTLNQKLQQENLRLGAELDVARQLQQAVLPNPEELVAIEGIDLVGYMESADEVGGDYYDVLSADGVITLAIGDVTGHGLESGILMLMTQTAVRTLQQIKESDPVRFLDTLNRTIYANVQRMNSEKTLTLAILNYDRGRVSISGQHEEILIVRANGQIEAIDTIDLGFPIGLDDEIADFIDRTEVELQSGDGIVLYTDGIPEAYNMQKEHYGMERFRQVISRNWQHTVEEIQQAAIDDLKRFIGAQKVFDDITLVVLKQQ